MRTQTQTQIEGKVLTEGEPLFMAVRKVYNTTSEGELRNTNKT